MAAAAGQMPQAQAQAQQLQMLRGAGPGQFNLEAVRARASELRVSLQEVLGALHTRPEHLHWDAVLKRFATINLQLLGLRESLRGVLRQVVVHPCMVDQPALSQVLPIQLASALLPEQAEAEKKLMAAEEQLLVQAGVAPEAWYEATDSQVEDFNRLVGSLVDAQVEARKALASRATVISRGVAALRQGQAPPSAAPAAGASKRARMGSAGQQPEGGLDPALRQLLTGEITKGGRS